ncbi:MAG: hypothetical protein V4629_00910 [Pseudomonadota bacterium]
MHSTVNSTYTEQLVLNETLFIPDLKFSTLLVEGDDAKQFLQGQVTVNVNKLSADCGALAACVNLQGRTQVSFFILPQDKKYLLVVPKNYAKKFVKTLKMYVLRANVVITDVSNLWKIYAFSGKNSGMIVNDLMAATDIHSFQMWNMRYLENDTESRFALRLPGIIQHWLIIDKNIEDFHQQSHTIAQRLSVALLDSTEAIWNYINLSAGLLLIDAELTDQWIPLELHYDKFGAVDFDKGCYRGQEIIARIHFRGQLKQQLAFFKITHSEYNFSETIYSKESGWKIITEVNPEKNHTIGNVIINFNIAENYWIAAMIKKIDFSQAWLIGESTPEKKYMLELLS